MPRFLKIRYGHSPFGEYTASMTINVNDISRIYNGRIVLRGDKTGYYIPYNQDQILKMIKDTENY